jgi:hypothetical protein
MDETQQLQLRKMIEEAMAKQQKAGAMGFDQKLYDKAMSDPQAMAAGAEMAGLMDDTTALGMMNGSNNYQVPNGGRLGWTDAMSKGIDKGIGTYNLLNAQKVKANALRAMAPKPGMPDTATGGAMNPTPYMPAQAFPVDMS